MPANSRSRELTPAAGSLSARNRSGLWVSACPGGIDDAHHTSAGAIGASTCLPSRIAATHSPVRSSSASRLGYASAFELHLRAVWRPPPPLQLGQNTVSRSSLSYSVDAIPSR